MVLKVLGLSQPCSTWIAVQSRAAKAVVKTEVMVTETAKRVVVSALAMALVTLCVCHPRFRFELASPVWWMRPVAAMTESL